VVNPAYSLLIALHVVTLVFCAGPVLTLALVSGALSPPAAQRLTRVASFGLLGLLVTGGVALAMTGPAFIHTWWLRISVLLFLLIGALTGRLRRLTKDAGSASRVRPLAWAITVALALAVYLMEGKPF
jgi:hypothetical protein